MALATLWLLALTSVATAAPVALTPDGRNLEFQVGAGKNIVVLPANYREESAARRRYPVVYVLHGYSGNYRDWYDHSVRQKQPLTTLADRYQAILVFPDGKFSSWYVNARPHTAAPDYKPEDWQMETYLTRDLVQAVDKEFRTWASAEGRAITGLSMGGHGAVTLGAKHPELYSAAGSMSGVMDLTGIPGLDLPKRLGAIAEHRAEYEKESAKTLLPKLAGRKFGLILDCGTGDFLWAQNVALHEALLKAKVPHDWYARPGGHTWDYWINALPYHLQYFSRWVKPAGNE